MRIATRQDWDTKPLPDAHTSINVHRDFSFGEMARIEAGLLPEAMEDKWFIYFEGNHLYFHRSWSGVCVYIGHFVENDGVYTMTSIDANRDADEYSGIDDGYDVKMVFFLIDLLLLGKDVEFPDQRASVAETWAVAGRAYVNADHKERVASLELWIEDRRADEGSTSSHSEQRS